MKFWDEDAVDAHLGALDFDALGEDFLRLTRWVISRDVRSPAWVDREDLVQLGLELCLKVVHSKIPSRPRMPYFAQVVKNGARKAVARACRAQPEQGEAEEDTVSPEDMAMTMIRSDAARTFPDIRDALVEAHRTGKLRTRKCIATVLSSAGKPGAGRAFAAMLQEELG